MTYIKTHIISFFIGLIICLTACQNNNSEYSKEISSLKKELNECKDLLEQTNMAIENKREKDIKIAELKTKKEAELKTKKEAELKTKKEAELKAKKEAELKTKKERNKKTKKQKGKKGWETDLNKAITTATQTNKKLLLFFTGSDWCGWCKKLVREVFNTPEFQKWAEKNVVLVELDFPKRTKLDPQLQKQNQQLQQQFQVRGYPTIWFVNTTLEEGNKVTLGKLGKIGYVAGGPASWIGEANKILKQ